MDDCGPCGQWITEKGVHAHLGSRNSQAIFLYLAVSLLLKNLWSKLLLELVCMIVQEKLFTSKNRSEASLGKKLKLDMLPEIEKVHKVLGLSVMKIPR